MHDFISSLIVLSGAVSLVGPVSVITLFSAGYWKGRNTVCLGPLLPGLGTAGVLKQITASTITQLSFALLSIKVGFVGYILMG